MHAPTGNAYASRGARLPHKIDYLEVDKSRPPWASALPLAERAVAAHRPDSAQPASMEKAINTLVARQMLASMRVGTCHATTTDYLAILEICISRSMEVAATHSGARSPAGLRR